MRFNTSDDIDKNKCELGQRIFYIPDLAKFVFTQPLKAQRGSDASNWHDEEPAQDVCAYCYGNGTIQEESLTILILS